MQRTWKSIFISYMWISKYLKIWTSYIYQVLIISKPIVNKSKRDADLLIKYPLPLLKKSLWSQAGKPKLRDQHCKDLLKKHLIAKPIKNNKISKETHVIEIFTKKYNKNKLVQIIVQTKKMRIHCLCNLKLKIDINRISGVNPLKNKLVRLCTSLQSQSSRLAAKCKNLKYTIRQLTTLFIEMDGRGLLIRSCEILIFTKPNTISYYKTIKRQLTINKCSR